MESTGRLDRGDGTKLAWSLLAGRGPIVVFLPGYNSDMAGSKATDLAAFCAARGQAFLRFDYSGHGASDGNFISGTIGIWLADALAVIDGLTAGKKFLPVGSSMGGWISLLVALARPEQVAGLVGIAAAPDFTENLMWNAMSFSERRQLMSEGKLIVPNPYGDPYPVTRALIEDGRKRLLLGGKISFSGPVRLLHGQRDAEVPWETALRIADQLESLDVQVTLVKDGDHRLSRPEDLSLLRRILDALLSQDGA